MESKVDGRKNRGACLLLFESHQHLRTMQQRRRVPWLRLQSCIIVLRYNRRALQQDEEADQTWRARWTGSTLLAGGDRGPEAALAGARQWRSSE